MTLPKLNNTPKYTITIPSSQKQVRYRPYLVKEEKILMLAIESNDQKQVLNTVVDTIVSCIEEPIERNTLTSFDVEYLFTQIRAKSVGETSTVGIKCSSCKDVNEVKIKLDTIKIDVPKVPEKIELDSKVSLKMRWPSYNNIVNSVDLDSRSPTEQTFDMIIQCIDSVLTDDEVIKMSEVPKHEAMAFIESFSSEQFVKIRQYVEKMPRMKHTVHFNCKTCNHENKITLQGMNDFF